MKKFGISQKKEDSKNSEETGGDERRLNIESDRITFHLGRKVSDDNYGNVTIGLTLSSSVKEKETLKDATKRVIEYVEEEVIAKTEEILNRDK